MTKTNTIQKNAKTEIIKNQSTKTKQQQHK